MSSIRNAFGALQAEYGFQGGNRVNQEENAVGLIKDFESRSKTVSDLRAELLSNYSMWVKWCGITPEQDDNERDIALYLMIWGEAANLRFTPELLCFLFHKLKEQRAFYTGVFRFLLFFELTSCKATTYFCARGPTRFFVTLYDRSLRK